MVEQGLWSKTAYSESTDDIHTNAQSPASDQVKRSILTRTSWLRWLFSRALRSIRMKSDAPDRNTGGDHSKVAGADSNMDEKYATKEFS